MASNVKGSTKGGGGGPGGGGDGGVEAMVAMEVVNRELVNVMLRERSCEQPSHA